MNLIFLEFTWIFRRSLTFVLVPLFLFAPVTTNGVVVSTKYGRVKGHRIRADYSLGSDAMTDTYDRFLGIPYAKPPTGKLRFKAPQEPDTWNHVLDATKHRSVCPQLEYSDIQLHAVHQSESCLFLNVFSPYKRNSDERYPVMVYFHGGSYEVGSGKTYDGSVLAQMGVVVVTINYRLGALGFLTSGDVLLPGNYGLLDQAMTLDWVRENIAQFRGNSSRVTLFGHSVGASSVGLMMLLSTIRPGLFHGVIAQSGVVTAPYTAHTLSATSFKTYIRLVGRLFNCPENDVQGTAECLRSTDFKRFLDSRASFPLFDPIDPEFRPFIDGNILTDDPRTLFQKGLFLRVPVIVGTVKEEFGNYFDGGARHRREFDEALDGYLIKAFKHNAATLDVVKFQYTDWKNDGDAAKMGYDRWRNENTHSMKYRRGDVLSDMHMVAPTLDMCDVLSKHVPVYQYHFSIADSYHSADLNYVFGAPFSGHFADELTVDGTVDMFTPRQRNLSLQIMKLWTNFARHGRPTLDGLEWTPYSIDERRYLHLSPDSIGIRRNLRSEQVAFWNSLVPLLSVNSTVTESPFRAAPGPAAEHRSSSVGLWVLLASVGVLVVLLLLLSVLAVRLALENRRFKRVGAPYLTKQMI